MAYAASKDKGDSTFKCPICLDIFDSPIEIPCGHSFCNDCIMSCLSKVSTSQCPVCRTSFTTMQMMDNRVLTRKMDTTSQLCSNCNKMVATSSLRNHRKVCSSMSADGSKQPPTFQPIAATSQPTARAPNRSTFKCPYCDMANLDREALIDHVNTSHTFDDKHVVCPVCASMPWGNPDQKSTDFKQHLNIRHKFNYDTYVDFHDEEDAILQSVLEKSKRDM